MKSYKNKLCCYWHNFIHSHDPTHNYLA